MTPPGCRFKKAYGPVDKSVARAYRERLIKCYKLQYNTFDVSHALLACLAGQQTMTSLLKLQDVQPNDLPEQQLACCVDIIEWSRSVGILKHQRERRPLVHGDCYTSAAKPTPKNQATHERCGVSFAQQKCPTANSSISTSVEAVTACGGRGFCCSPGLQAQSTHSIASLGAVYIPKYMQGNHNRPLLSIF